MKDCLRSTGKRFLGIMLTAALIITLLSLPVTADEAAATDETQNTDDYYVTFPGEFYLGLSWPEVFESENASSDASFDVSANSSVENKTTADGIQYTVAAITGKEYAGSMEDHYYYLVDNKVLASIYKYLIPEQYSVEQTVERMKMYGTPIPLDLSTVSSSLVEIMSDQVQLQTGMSSWPKERYTGVAFVDEASRSLYCVALAQQAEASASSEVKMSGLTGTEDLTPAEVEQVNTYIDFIQSRMVQQVNEYIAFLKSRRDSAN